MNLSLYTGGVKPYLEYGWVCAPNAAGQSIAANTITTLTIDTEVADTGNFGSVASNQITLAAGTYYYEASVGFNTVDGMLVGGVLGLFNVTAGTYVSRAPSLHNANNGYSNLKGQFSLVSSAVFELRAVPSGLGFRVANFSYIYPSTLTTAGADQRTTLKLWKLA
jgi:hypothetical protein